MTTCGSQSLFIALVFIEIDFMYLKTFSTGENLCPLLALKLLLFGNVFSIRGFYERLNTKQTFISFVSCRLVYQQRQWIFILIGLMLMIDMITKLPIAQSPSNNGNHWVDLLVIGMRCFAIFVCQQNEPSVIRLIFCHILTIFGYDFAADTLHIYYHI